MGFEFVIVTYPTNRPVYIDSGGREERHLTPSGDTNEVLGVDAGTHVFDLGASADYDPPFKKVVVVGTTVLAPMLIVFTRKVGKKKE
jgi:hypothetical protein